MSPMEKILPPRYMLNLLAPLSALNLSVLLQLLFPSPDPPDAAYIRCLFWSFLLAYTETSSCENNGFLRNMQPPRSVGRLQLSGLRREEEAAVCRMQPHS